MNLQKKYRKQLIKIKDKNDRGHFFAEKPKLNGITPSFITRDGITKINNENPEQQYPQVCFDYIHQNAVKAGIVKSPVDWEYSSAIDYAGIRDGKLINRTVAEEYIRLH